MFANMMQEGNVDVLAKVFTKLKNGMTLLYYSKLIETKNGIEYLDEKEDHFSKEINKTRIAFNAAGEYFYINIATEDAKVYRSVRSLWNDYMEHATSVRLDPNPEAVEDHCMRVIISLVDEMESIGYFIEGYNPIIVANEDDVVTLVFKAELVNYSMTEVDLVEYLSDLEYEQAEEERVEREAEGLDTDENEIFISNDNLLDV